MRWGFIGFGRIAQKFLSSLRCFPSEEVVAIATKSNPQEAKRLCPSAYIYNSYQSLVEDMAVDIVYINTTHNFHYEHTLLCLQHGKHVICEKPMGLTPLEVDHIASVKGDLFVMEALWTRFLPTYRQMKEWVSEGKIGQVKLVKADFAFASTLPTEGRLLNPALAGGAMYDIGIYPLSLAQDLSNQSLPYKMNTHIDWTDTGVDGSVVYQLHYEGGMTAQLFCSILMNSPNEALIIGSEGYIRMPLFWKGQEVELCTKEGKIRKERRFHDSGYYHEIEEVINCSRSNKSESEVMPIAASRQLAHLMDKILHSETAEIVA